MGAAHGGHLGADVQRAHVAGAVGLAEHAVDVSGEVVEPEAEVEVHEAVPVGPAVLVNPIVLVGDGNGVGRDGEHAIELDEDAVDGVSAGDDSPGRVPDDQRASLTAATSTGSPSRATTMWSTSSSHRAALREPM